MSADKVMKTFIRVVLSVVLGAAIAGVFVSRQQAAVLQAEKAAFARRDAEMAVEKARLEKALASARGRTVTVETAAPAPLAQIIEVNRGPSAR